ncbi:MAG: hypothetical protein JW839_03880 [Candidatus Lokiarchaeota archaeon]|nr:hypothetical protein [Candidatus Lokiarchaeota archaeon]
MGKKINEGGVGLQTSEDAPRENAAPPARPAEGNGVATNVLGIEQGFVMFRRKPAKMGDDHIFWIPRVYIKNGLVDPACEYEVYLKKH